MARLQKYKNKMMAIAYRNRAEVIKLAKDSWA
jgi:hypothetical protein